MLRQLLNPLLPLLLFVGFYACVRAFFSSIKRSALRQQPRQNGVALEFFPVAGMQFLVRLVLISLAAFAILVAMAMRREAGTFYAPLIPLSVFTLILLTNPMPVVLDQNGIRQQRWLLREKEIAWKDIASIAWGSNTGTTYVCSKHGGAKIRFSAFLVGRARFKQEIRSHVQAVDIFEDD